MQQKTISIQNGDGANVASVAAYHGPDVITIKRLGWKRLAEAAKEQQKAQFAQAQTFAVNADAAKVIAEGIKAMAEARAKYEAEHPEEVKAESLQPIDPLVNYDASSLLCAGVVAFDGKTLSNPKEQTDELELETAEACARAILRLSRPGLFETEADRKNG